MQIVPLIQYPNQELMCILGNQNCTIRVTVRSGYTFLDLRVDDMVIFTEEEAAEVDRAWRLDAEKLHGPDDFTAGYGIGPYGLMRYGLF